MGKIPMLCICESDSEEFTEDDFELKFDKGYVKHLEEFSSKENKQYIKERENDLKELEQHNDSDSCGSEDDPSCHVTYDDINNLAYCADQLLSSKYGVKPALSTEIFSSQNNSAEDGVEKKKKKKKYTLEVYRKELFDKIANGEVPEYESDEGPPPAKSTAKKIDLFEGEDVDFDNLFVTEEQKQQKLQIKNDIKKSRDEKDEEVMENVNKAFDKPNLDEDDIFYADFLKYGAKEMLKEMREDDEESVSPEDTDSQSSHPTSLSNAPAMHGFLYEGEDVTTRKTIAKTAENFDGDGMKVHVPVSHGKNVTSSVRLKDNRRKDERERKKDRKEAEKRRLREEVNEMKAMMRNEILDKLSKIKKVTGLNKLAFDEKDLDENFDAEEHERKMEQMYNEDYYEDCSGKKPQFEYDEDIDGDFVTYDEFHANEKDYVDYNEDEGDVQTNGHEGHADDDVNTYYSEAPLSRRRRRGRNKKFTEALLRKKPKFNASKHGDFEEYFDEHYALDFEDIVGGVKCRFKYKTVEPNSFGLSTEEIFMADDKDLNKFYSLKKLLRTDRTCDQESKERKVFRKRVQDEEYMRRVFPSLYEQENEDEELIENPIIDENESQRREEDKKKKKNLKKKLRREKKIADEALLAKKENRVNKIEKEIVNGVDEQEMVINEKVKEENKKKRKREVETQQTEEITKKSKKRKLEKDQNKCKSNHKNESISDKDPLSTILKISTDRLSAYGLPAAAQLKKKIIYLKNQEKRGVINDALESFKYPVHGTDKKKRREKNKKKKNKMEQKSKKTKKNVDENNKH